MKPSHKQHRPGILKKLTIVNILIIAAFIMIAISVALSFRNIGSFSGDIINQEVNEVIRNAELGRDLNVVFAESDLLVSTFMGKDVDVRKKGDRIVARVTALGETVSNPKLKGAMGDFAQQLQSLFRQCATVYDHSAQLVLDEKEVEKDLSGIEWTLSRKLISMKQQGKDVSMLEQISMLLFGYRETLLQISIRHARLTSKHPETMDAKDGEEMLALLNDLNLRLKTLTGSESFVATYGSRLMRNVKTYEEASASFLRSMDDLKTKIEDVRKSRKMVITAMKEVDRDVSLTAERMKGNVSQVMSNSGTFILLTSGTIIICLILFTLVFSYRDIRRPMELIRQGIESIRKGDLETRIRMNRGDEWGDIEDAMNMMVEDLKRSYSDLQEKNLELELAQSDLESKVVELEMEMTERKRVEDALSESEHRLYATIQGSPIPTFVIDTGMRVVYWNSALERLSGKSAVDLLGTDQAWAALYEEEQPVLAGLLIRGDHEGIEHWYAGKYSLSRLVEGAYEVTDFFPGFGDGGRWIHTTAAVLRDANGEVIGAIETLEDISERKQLEEQLRQSQKMEAIGQLAGGVAHDFNNILTAIMGFGNLLQLKTPDDMGVRKYVNQIVSSAERGAKLTHSLLAFSRKHVAELKTVNLKEIIVHLKNLLARLVREDIELRIAAEDDCFIRADSMQIEQVMMNLVTNARDAMQDGGVLTIRTGRYEMGEDFARSHGYGEPGRYALLSVSDTGTGMDENTREKIFEPFFTSKTAGKGTGLGLSIVYGIIKQHNGHIDVQSEPGKGTTFNIYLPLIGDTVEQTEPVEETISLPQGTELLLLADDDPLVRDLTRELLQEFGYTVIEAEDGDDAVNKFLPRRNEISLVILDAIMPKKNGMEVFNEIKNYRPDIKALFISGYTGDVLSRKGMLDNELEIISKPFVQSALLRKVREIIDR